MKINHKKCENCKYAKTIHANGNWQFIGCSHEPYKGKWVREIKNCPKESNQN